jgi:transmembrane sensor
MIGPPTPRPEEADLDAALAWHAALREADAGPAQWQAFIEWLEARPEHRLAFDRVEDLQAMLARDAARILALLPETDGVEGISANDNRRRRWPGRAAIGAAAALAAAGLVLLWLPDRTGVPSPELVYEAAPGHTRTVALADGTRLDLRPGSRLDVRYDAASRRLRLDRGEALVQVGHDRSRPLVVLAGDLIVRDIGTVFDVAMRPGRLAVTVVSGLVAVSEDGADGAAAARHSIQLSAGQQFLHTPGVAAAEVVQVDPAAVLSWRSGFLTYHDAPLSDVVADINRTFGAHVTLADAATGARRFSGVLKAESLDGTLRRLSVLLALPVIQRGDAVQLGATNTSR